METFEELESEYLSKISEALHELRVSGATADELWVRLDKLRDEYVDEYQRLCFNMLKSEILKL